MICIMEYGVIVFNATIVQLYRGFSDVCCIEYTSSWSGFELQLLVVLGAYCIGNCKSNYHTITTTKIHIMD